MGSGATSATRGPRHRHTDHHRLQHLQGGVRDVHASDGRAWRGRHRDGEDLRRRHAAPRRLHPDEARSPPRDQAAEGRPRQNRRHHQENPREARDVQHQGERPRPLTRSQRPRWRALRRRGEVTLPRLQRQAHLRQRRGRQLHRLQRQIRQRPPPAHQLPGLLQAGGARHAVEFRVQGQGQAQGPGAPGRRRRRRRRRRRLLRRQRRRRHRVHDRHRTVRTVRRRLALDGSQARRRQVCQAGRGEASAATGRASLVLG